MKRLFVALLLALLVVAGQAGVRRLDFPNNAAGRTVGHAARVGPAALHLGEVPR